MLEREAKRNEKAKLEKGIYLGQHIEGPINL